jgi:hypothetical protein
LSKQTSCDSNQSGNSGTPILYSSCWLRKNYGMIVEGSSVTTVEWWLEIGKVGWMKMKKREESHTSPLSRHCAHSDGFDWNSTTRCLLVIRKY